MKKILITIFAIIMASCVYSQDYYYYHNKRIFFEKHECVRNICFAPSTSIQQKKILLDSLQKYTIGIDTFSHFSYRLYVDSIHLNTAKRILSNHSSIIQLDAPELTRQQSTFWASRDLLVKTKFEADLKSVLDSMGICYQSYENKEYDKQRYCVRICNDSAVKYAQQLYETDLFEFAEPDFYCIAELNGYSDNYLYDSQWAIHNDSININLLPAWEITNAGKHTKVAAIDVGVQLDHEDLIQNLVDGYDAVVDEWGDLSAIDGAPESVLDSHGTRCAGIIGAENNNVGCVGIAYNSNIIPIRTAYTRTYYAYQTRDMPPPPPGPNLITELILNKAWLIDAMENACYVRNADVISFSIAESGFSDAVESKITEICHNGREGKGIIFIISAGNTYNTSNSNADTLEYMAKHPDVVSVGSVSPCGSRISMLNPCSNISADYNSCYGDSLDIVAPGILIPTTSYIDEYVTNAYVTAFAGTSAAAPHVAGVAALVLSVNPCLTREEVTYILESTCTKIRPDLYIYSNDTNHPNGTWNNEVGHGLVNAYEAVLLAQQMGGYVFRSQHTISYNTLWDTVSLINNDLVIDSLATLTITDTLHIAADARIIVRPGGKLIVNGGTLTSACEGEMWQGIIVEGHNNIRQAALAQGSVILNNAIIENAWTAISTRGADTNTVYEHTGGIVQATNTLFRNNRRSVEFLSYENHTTSNQVTDNASYFTRCTFTVDDDNLFVAQGRDFENHVTMWRVRGVKFNGCSFRNEMSSATAARGKAISTEEAGFNVKRVCPTISPADPCVCENHGTDTVTRCSFVGFDTAVHTSSTLGNYDITLDNCDFRQNFRGVHLATADNDRISFCDFDLDFNVNANTGLFLKNCTGYTVEDNVFKRSTYLTSTSVGICCDNSGTSENVIRRNEFFNLNYGCYVQNQNATRGMVRPQSGLQFNCNSFDDCKMGIYVRSGAKMRISQGSASVGADNVFGVVQNSGRSLTVPSDHSSVKYYRSTGGNHQPIGTSNYTVQNATANGCGSTICGIHIDNPIVPGLKGGALPQYRSMAEHLGQLQEQYENIQDLESEEAVALQSEMSDLSAAMSELARTEIRGIISDSVPDLALLKDWYKAINTPLTHYLMAETQSTEGLWDKARATLEDIPVRFELDDSEKDEYTQYGSLQSLREAVLGNWYKLSDSQIAEMQQVAESGNGRAARMAMEILCFFHHICYEDAPFLDEMDQPEFGTRGLAVGKADPDNALTLSPNPANSTVTLQLADAQDEIRQITVANMQGQVMLSQTVNATTPYTLDISSLPAGIYVVRVLTANGTVATAKVVKE